MKRALLLLACCGHHDGLDEAKARQLFDRIPLDVPPGMSGLAVDDHGTLWAVPERDRVLVEIHLDPLTVTRHPLDGVPDGVDTEALAYLGPGRFAIGTEGQHEATASMLYAELQGDRAVVTRTRALSNEDLGVALVTNHGVEGACGSGDDVYAAIETVATEGTARFAPLVHLHGDALVRSRVRLTTDVGKISALDCTIENGTAHAWAIERHYAVSRILRFDVPPTGGDITPTVTLDLAPVLRDSYNLEGIVQLPDGRLVTINDNQGATVKGPTELFVFHPR